MPESGQTTVFLISPCAHTTEIAASTAMAISYGRESPVRRRSDVWGFLWEQMADQVYFALFIACRANSGEISVMLILPLQTQATEVKSDGANLIVHVNVSHPVDRTGGLNRRIETVNLWTQGRNYPAWPPSIHSVG